MSEKKLKSYQIGDSIYEFDYLKFAGLCADRSKRKKLKKSSLNFLMYMEEKLNYEVSYSTIKGWMYGNNSPATIDMVEKIAKEFSMTKLDLLKLNGKVNEMNSSENIIIDEKTREVVANLYGKFVDGIFEFKRSEGFSVETYNNDCSSLKLEEDDSDMGYHYVKSVNSFEVGDAIGKWYDFSDELEKNIKKSRLYLKKDVINQLYALCELIFEPLWIDGELNLYASMKDRNPDGEYTLIDKDGNKTRRPISELGPTDFDDFLAGREINEHTKYLYLCHRVDEFYKMLDNILKDYLP